MKEDKKLWHFIYCEKSGWDDIRGAYVVSKKPGHRNYYPLEGIFEEGKTYDFITNSLCSGDKSSVIHQVRPVHPPKIVTVADFLQEIHVPKGKNLFLAGFRFR